MSRLPMTSVERRHRHDARMAGKLALCAIELTRPWNRAGDRYVDMAYRHARLAAAFAARALRAEERRR